ncbi:MAG: hypothetical protein IT385_09570 [Deltaproteobacteria bacterium]|nr:hypothetical protein [Deltaproteobacteria bacterium]
MMLRNHIIKRWLGPVTIVAGAALGASALSGCAQERVGCQTAHGDFIMKFTLKSGTGACAEHIGGVFGVQTYYGKGDGTRPDFSEARVAIQSEELGAAVDEAEERLGEIPDANNPPYAIGAFAKMTPDGDSLCSVPTFAPAKKDIPTLPAVPDDPQTTEDDESLPAVPARSFQHEWSGVQVLVSEAATGTQLIGTFKVTEDGCTAEYEAWGLYPAVYCGDDDGNPVDEYCNAEPNPDAGLPIGSGINPDFPVHCDPELLFCMVTSKPPTQ